MEIKKENVLAAYEAAREMGADSTMKVLEELFGKETFKPKDITERVKTFEDALMELGAEHPLVVEWSGIKNRSRDLDAYLKLRIICAALNEGWEPEFTGDEVRWYPWHFLWTEDELSGKDEAWKRSNALIPTDDYVTEYEGLACEGSYIAPSASTAFGSRLCLKSKALSDYCGKQFIRLWADFKLMRK